MRGLLAISLAVIAGCGTNATVRQRSGRIVEGTIVRGGPRYLTIETAAGTEVALERAEIDDIDHPGNAAAVVGGLLGAYGALNIYVGMPQCSTQGGAYCIGVLAPGIVGLGLFVYGLATWHRSVTAAERDGEGGRSSRNVLRRPSGEVGVKNYHGLRRYVEDQKDKAGRWLRDPLILHRKITWLHTMVPHRLQNAQIPGVGVDRLVTFSPEKVAGRHAPGSRRRRWPPSPAGGLGWTSWSRCTPRVRCCASIAGAGTTTSKQTGSLACCGARCGHRARRTARPWRGLRAATGSRLGLTARPARLAAPRRS